VDHADHVVEASLVNRDASVAALDTGLNRLVDTGLDRHRSHVQPRRHHLLGDGLVEPEDPLEHLVFFLLDDAFALAGLDHVLDLRAGHITGFDRRLPAGESIDLPGEEIEGDHQREEHVAR